MSERTYTIVLSGLIAGLLAFVLILDFLIDPYRLRLAGSAPDSVVLRPDVRAFSRLNKSFAAGRSQADVVLLGSSRAQNGFEREALQRRGLHPLNLAFPAPRVDEFRTALDCALRHARPGIVLVSLNFTAFNLHDPQPTAPFECDSSFLRAVRLYAGGSAFRASWSAVRATLTDREPQSFSTRQELDPDGFSRAEMRFGSPLRSLGHRPLFVMDENRYMVGYLRPYVFEKTNGQSSLSDFRALLRLARSSGIELKLFIDPEHVRQLELVRAAGLWQTYEEWKRQLVRLVEEENRGSAKPAALWDFSGYDQISTEPVPAIGDRETRMLYFADLSHYTPRVGEFIVARMLGEAGEARQTPPEFGVQLTSANLEERLTEIRRLQQDYRERHSAEVEELERRVAIKQERAARR